MGVTGFLALATQLDHILLGPQRLYRADGLSADRKSRWIQSDRTTFAWPFRRDRIEYQGKTHTKTFLSPIGIMPEAPILIKPLRGRADRNIAMFNGFEVYPADAHGRVLVEVDGVVKGLRLERKGGQLRTIAGCKVHDGKIMRNPDGTLKGTLEESDGVPTGLIWKHARTRDRVKNFVHHPVFIINPRLLVTLIVSGAFDTAWYFIGKDVGRREAEYHAGLGAKPKNASEKRIIATTMLPIPLAAPTSPKNVLEQTAADAGIVQKKSPNEQTTQALLAQSLPMPGNIAQFVSGINANASTIPPT